MTNIYCCKNTGCPTYNREQPLALSPPELRRQHDHKMPCPTCGDDHWFYYVRRTEETPK